MRVKLNYREFARLRNGPEVVADLTRRAAAIAAAAEGVAKPAELRRTITGRARVAVVGDEEKIDRSIDAGRW